MTSRKASSALGCKDIDTTGLSDKGKRTLAMLTALEGEERLNDWEEGFVNDVSDWFLIKERELTSKQYETLERIYRQWY